MRCITSLCELTRSCHSYSVMLITPHAPQVAQIGSPCHIGKTYSCPPLGAWDGGPAGAFAGSRPGKSHFCRASSHRREPGHIRRGGSSPILIQERIYPGPDLLRGLPALTGLESGDCLWRRQKRNTLWRIQDNSQYLTRALGTIRGNRQWVVQPVRIVGPGGSALSEARYWLTSN